MGSSGSEGDALLPGVSTPTGSKVYGMAELMTLQALR